MYCIWRTRDVLTIPCPESQVPNVPSHPGISWDVLHVPPRTCAESQVPNVPSHPGISRDVLHVPPRTCPESQVTNVPSHPGISRDVLHVPARTCPESQVPNVPSHPGISRGQRLMAYNSASVHHSYSMRILAVSTFSHAVRLFSEKTFTFSLLAG